MSPALFGVEGDAQGSHSFPNGSGLKERNYLGLSDCSSVESSAVSSLTDERKNNMNLKATELRLGLPGSQSPERDPEVNLLNSEKLEEKPLFPLLSSKEGICSPSQKAVALGNKRGFSDTVDCFSEVKAPLFSGKGGINGKLSSVAQAAPITEEPVKVSQERPHSINAASHNRVGSNNSGTAPAAKAQVVGWPPIRSFRKNTLASTPKSNDEVDGKPGPGALFVKVSMDEAPYQRKVDLRSYSTYQELSTALEKMFSCFITVSGQCSSHGAPGRDLLRGSDYVLAYEDKDGDWMRVGDIPWEMFIDLCQRLKIMKGSDAIGVAPRAAEPKNRN